MAAVQLIGPGNVRRFARASVATDETPLTILNSQNFKEPAERLPANGPLSLAEAEVQVWTAPLDLGDHLLAKFAETLSADEQDRARRFKFDHHRNRFIAGRGWMRATLARYLEVPAAKLDFSYSPLGKPALSSAFDPARLHFNLAHSSDLALLAVTRIGPIGVDVECIRPVKDAADLVARFFCASENESFQRLPPDRKPVAFFNLWTRKEALLKATGEGIGKSLNEVEVSFLPGEPARLLGIAGDSEKAALWSLHDLAAPDGFVAALAIQASGARVSIVAADVRRLT